MNTSASYSPRAARALGFLKKGKNDIEIYVEDSANPSMWLQYLRNVLPGDCLLSSVNVLGGRDKVIGACRLDQKDRSRKRIYIIDADFDIILGRARPRLRYLYRLRSYCLENYFLNMRTLVFAATTAEPSCTEADAVKRIALDHWLGRNNKLLISIFVCYALVAKFKITITTVSFSVHRLSEDANPRVNLCPVKVHRRLYRIYRELSRRVNSNELRKSYDLLSSLARKRNALEIVSGKDYVFPLIFLLLRHEFKLSIRNEQLKVLLASKTGREVDPYLPRTLSRLLSS